MRLNYDCELFEERQDEIYEGSEIDFWINMKTYIKNSNTSFWWIFDI